MVEIVAVTCPKCGANLKLPEGLEKAFCIYCSAEVIIEREKPDTHLHFHREGTYVVERKGDIKWKQSRELQVKVAKKELEIEELHRDYEKAVKEAVEWKKKRRYVLVLSVCIVIVGLVATIIGTFTNSPFSVHVMLGSFLIAFLLYFLSPIFLPSFNLIENRQLRVKNY